ncbi:MAG TPA: hypothetical protein VHM26_06145 [Chitinophagaceae bacterium]|jgi:hypothetical protein|nr:hypothetical protein [Chitinophagaceae bacterium]
MMNKQNMLILALVIGGAAARAQSSLTTLEYKKNMEPALVVRLSNSTAHVEALIIEKLKQAGYDPSTTGHLFWKSNKKDGFYSFYNVIFPTLATYKLDMFFKVVQQDKEEKNNSTVYLLVSTGNDNFSSPDQNPEVWNWSRAFMNNLPAWSASHALETDIGQQETALNDSRKKMTGLQEDERDLNGKIKKYREGLADNRRNQENLQIEIDNKVKAIELLQGQRINIDASEFQRVMPSMAFDKTPAVKIAYPYP